MPTCLTNTMPCSSGRRSARGLPTKRCAAPIMRLRRLLSVGSSTAATSYRWATVGSGISAQAPTPTVRPVRPSSAPVALKVVATREPAVGTSSGGRCTAAVSKARRLSADGYTSRARLRNSANRRGRGTGTCTRFGILASLFGLRSELQFVGRIGGKRIGRAESASYREQYLMLLAEALDEPDAEARRAADVHRRRAIAINLRADSQAVVDIAFDRETFECIISIAGSGIVPPSPTAEDRPGPDAFLRPQG